MEANNMASMREAMKCIDSIAKYLEAGTIRDVQHAYRNIQDRVRIALSKPPRNCDVGTEQEQQDRFREFCRHYESKGECGIGRSEAACPAFQGGRNPDCSLWWAQRPYTEGILK